MSNDEIDGGLTESKHLWIDPLANRETSGPVLLAEEIREYVNKHSLLFKDKDNFSETNLKGASYSMRPHPEDAYYFDENGNKKQLEKGTDKSGEYHEVKQNSLVFIMLEPRLVLPYYIIGRHNLKIGYVYQGLLLGTGPQVDPGYEGNLYIPLHNLTTRDVRIYINESFVSIDFVRTTPIVLDEGIPNTRKEFEELYKKMNPIPTKKIKRVELEHYLKGAKPSSALGEFIQEIERSREEIEQYKTENRKENEQSIKNIRTKVEEYKNESREEIKNVTKWRNVFNLTIFIAIAALIITMFYMSYQIVSTFSTRIDTVFDLSDQSVDELQSIKDRLEQISSDIKKIDSMSNEMDKIRAEHNLLDQKFKQINSDINTTGKHTSSVSK